jgi:soluble lytic murein transglycosylase-like protein
MRKLRSTYVHRGDAIRRRNRAKKLIAWVTVVGAALFVIANRQPSTPIAEAAAETAGSSTSFRFGLMWENRRLRQEVENTAGEAALLRAQVERATRIMDYSATYSIPANLAATIFDIALQEGLDPELAFRVVKLESGFNPKAVSRVGAIGLAQVMPATAKQADASVTRARLFDPKTNLTIGFRHLRRLIGTYDGDVRVALLAYNVGEVPVNAARRAGKDPLIGYNRILIPGYQGTGISN